MRNRTLICAVLAVCFMFLQFAIPAYASDGGEEVLTVNAAWLDGDMLRINVTDADGVSSALALHLKEYVNDAENKEYISIQAMDMAGNKSGVIEIKNPYYVPPVVTEVKQSDTVVPNLTEQPQSSQSAVPDGSKPFTPDGTGTVMDNVTENDGKEFFTIDTEDGSVFYLIVDRQKNADNVYLLNAVTEDDLMALAQKNGKTVNNGTSAIPTTEPDTTVEQKPPTEPTVTPEVETPAKNSGNNNMIIFVIIAVVAVGGVGYYFKIVKGKKNAPDTDDIEDDYDYDFENEPEETAESGADDEYGDYNPEEGEREE